MIAKRLVSKFGLLVLLLITMFPIKRALGSTIALSGANGASISFIGGVGTDPYSRPFGGISGDGGTVVGFSRTSRFAGTDRAWEWTAAGGIVQIPSLSVATSVSYDGSVIVGTTAGNSGLRITPTGTNTLSGADPQPSFTGWIGRHRILLFQRPGFSLDHGWLHRHPRTERYLQFTGWNDQRRQHHRGSVRALQWQ